jgi:hypothetical protein
MHAFLACNTNACLLTSSSFFDHFCELNLSLLMISHSNKEPANGVYTGFTFVAGSGAVPPSPKLLGHPQPMPTPSQQQKSDEGPLSPMQVGSCVISKHGVTA